MTTQGIVARAEMLMLLPVAMVLEAFVDPKVTSRFWFSRGSAKLEVATAFLTGWRSNVSQPSVEAYCRGATDEGRESRVPRLPNSPGGSIVSE